MSELGQVQIISVLREILETLKEIQSKQDWFMDQMEDIDEYNQGDKNV